jgi:hypothetical protein
MDDTTYEPIRDEMGTASQPATRGDLQILATGINERFNLLPTKDDFSQLMTSVDRLAGEVKIYNSERTAESERLRRIEQ